MRFTRRFLLPEFVFNETVFR